MTDTGTSLRFAVVGAGIAGLACARTLGAQGAQVTVFEKDGTAGGRAATVIDECGPYDHGAQYFTASRDRFVTEVRRWEIEGVAQRWRGLVYAFAKGAVEDRTQSTERFVAVPGMRRLGVYMAQGLDVRYGQPIAGLERDGGKWLLRPEGAASAGLGPFDAVCVALPSDLAATLLLGHTELVTAAQTVNWDPCWAVTLAMARPSNVEFEGAFFSDDPILGWAALDSAKPRRGKVEGIAERWVLHAKPRWSRRYFEMDPTEVSRWLVRSFSARLRRPLSPVLARALRWSHATPLNPLRQSHLWDADNRLGMAGDWCDGPRIEGAFLSGQALAEAAME